MSDADESSRLPNISLRSSSLRDLRDEYCRESIGNDLLVCTVSGMMKQDLCHGIIALELPPQNYEASK